MRYTSGYRCEGQLDNRISAAGQATRMRRRLSSFCFTFFALQAKNVKQNDKYQSERRLKGDRVEHHVNPVWNPRSDRKAEWSSTGMTMPMYHDEEVSSTGPGAAA